MIRTPPLCALATPLNDPYADAVTAHVDLHQYLGDSFVTRATGALDALWDILRTPARQVTAQRLMDAGMSRTGASDLHTLLQNPNCTDDEIWLHILATPTLHAWAIGALSETRIHQRTPASRRLSLRVLQLFGHTTSVRGTTLQGSNVVMFRYAPGIDETSHRAPTDGIAKVLYRAQFEAPPTDMCRPRQVLEMLLDTDEDRHLAAHRHHWIWTADGWQHHHASAHVKTVAFYCDARYRAWIEPRLPIRACTSETADARMLTLMSQVEAMCTATAGGAGISSTASSDPAPSRRPAHPDA